MDLSFLQNYDFFTGVPDSYLKAVCDGLITKYGLSKQHLIAANEGNAVALAAGYHLATGKTPVVYLQNSGIGNIINPVTSLLHPAVYGIPCLFLIGWRGEPNTKDEPQHIYQGANTIPMLESAGMTPFVITSQEDLDEKQSAIQNQLAAGEQVALVFGKDVLSFSGKVDYGNDYTLTREEILEGILVENSEDFFVTTTGKTSREWFELREKHQQGHSHDFLTVGSMGHSSSLTLALAEQQEEHSFFCIDGDGALLMHMGAMALLGQRKPKNLIHILINNEAHESVGGAPTVAGHIDFPAIAKACGYPMVQHCKDIPDLLSQIALAKKEQSLCFLEINCAIGSRKDLGRPTVSPIQNKQDFMKELQS